MPAPLRRHGPLALRLLVSAALLVVVAAYVDVRDVAATVGDGDWEWFAAALAFMGAATVVGALRWWLLLRSADMVLSRRRAVRTFAGSLFLNHVLPTSVGGDAARTWLVGRESGRFFAATAATLVDKATSVGCAFLVAWAALLVDREGMPGSVLSALIWVSVGLAAALIAVVAAAAGVRPVAHRLPGRFAAMLREAWIAFKVWATSAKLVVGLLSLGVLYQVLALLSLVLAAWTVNVDLSFALAAVVAPIVVVAMLLPISVGGLGVREGSFVLLLADAGIDGAEATVISLLSALVIILASAAVVVLSATYDAIIPRASA